MFSESTSYVAISLHNKFSLSTKYRDKWTNILYRIMVVWSRHVYLSHEHVSTKWQQVRFFCRWSSNLCLSFSLSWRRCRFVCDMLALKAAMSASDIWESQSSISSSGCQQQIGELINLNHKFLWCENYIHSSRSTTPNLDMWTGVYNYKFRHV